MKFSNNELKELWDAAQEYPYTERKFNTTSREFKPSFEKSKDLPLIPLTFKQINVRFKFKP